MRLFTVKERQLLIQMCEAKITINKSYITLREKDAEICKGISQMTGLDASKIVNVDDILLELSKQTLIHK